MLRARQKSLWLLPWTAPLLRPWWDTWAKDGLAGEPQPWPDPLGRHASRMARSSDLPSGEGEGVDWKARGGGLSLIPWQIVSPNLYSLACGSELLPVAKQPTSSSSPWYFIDVQARGFSTWPASAAPGAAPSQALTCPLASSSEWTKAGLWPRPLAQSESVSDCAVQRQEQCSEGFESKHFAEWRL